MGEVIAILYNFSLGRVHTSEPTISTSTSMLSCNSNTQMAFTDRTLSESVSDSLSH